ncbi:unnamed protein product [Cylicocyclus nassatus]|uniref:Neurotransmitter-gated ion-channel ligand-binding domain-containing protein n=1 Tax=Cylicocyclus nassatus TaxID=53992 RepID=A0AA36GS90_CYLNA|nr:unnamed protein product [Cylicocyclus nassatus]
MVTVFPFDHQNCSLKLLSYSFYRHEIKLQNAIFEDLDISTVGNDEWEVTNIISCNDQLNSSNGEAVQLGQSLRSTNCDICERNPSYYIALIIIPSFILTFLCVAGLFSSSLIVDDLDKFCMGLTTIMSTTVMIGIVAENIPKTKIIPNLIVYVTTNLIIVGTAILIIIVLPKISQFLEWIFRCCKLRCARRHCGIPMGMMNAALLVIFEGYVIKNLLDLVGGAFS